MATGAERYRADIAVANGKIAEIGKVSDGAKKVVDASDLIVAPGFVDPHTHYGRPDLLGSAHYVLFLAWGHESGDGQLRGRPGSV